MKPIQVINGVACVEVPAGVKACDHVEESNFPVETFGKIVLRQQKAGGAPAT